MKNDAKYLKVGLTSNTTYLFFSMDILITLDVHRTKTSYPPGYPEKKIKRYKAQKLFSELNTDLCTPLKQPVHSQAFSGRNQNRTVALFISIPMPSMV